MVFHHGSTCDCNRELDQSVIIGLLRTGLYRILATHSIDPYLKCVTPVQSKVITYQNTMTTYLLQYHRSALSSILSAYFYRIKFFSLFKWL